MVNGKLAACPSPIGQRNGFHNFKNKIFCLSEHQKVAYDEK
jgi:hypothetical protein